MTNRLRRWRKLHARKTQTPHYRVERGREKSLVSKEEVELPESWEMVDEFSELKPITLYGVTKLFDEDLGRYCALTTPVSVIHLRVSNCTPVDWALPGRS